MKKLALVVAGGAALVAPTGAFAHGIVLQVQPSHHLVAVAQSEAGVKLIHTSAAARLHVGQRVDITAHTLSNGTLAATKVTVRGHAGRVAFRGLLLAERKGRVVVSAGGAVIALHDEQPAPAPGTPVSITASVSTSGTLTADTVTPFSPTNPGGQIEGSLTIGSGTITVSSEGTALVLKVPTGFDLTGFTADEEVLATFAQAADGSLVLTKLVGDDQSQTTGNAGAGGGHGGGDDGGSDDGSGTGSGSGGGDDGSGSGD